MTSPGGGKSGGGKSTTIGKAVLEIIPSLRGVSDAIEQQIDGKVVEVKIAPKVDQRAAEDAGRQTKAAVEKQTADVKVTPKADTRAAEQAGKATGDVITKGTKDAVTKGDIGKTIGDEVTKTVQKTSPGKELAKIIVDGLASGAKDELRGGPLGDILVDGLAEGVKQGIDRGGLGKTILDTLSNGVKSGNPGGSIRDAILPGIKQIGTDIRTGATGWSKGVADALRGGDIQGATDNIGNKVRATTDIIANIGSTFGLQLDGVRDFGDQAATTLDDVGGKASDAHDQFTGIRDQIKGSTDELLGLTNNSGKIAGGLNTIANAAGPLAAVFTVLDKGIPGWHGAMTSVLDQIQGKKDFDAKSWFNFLTPGTNLIDKGAKWVQENVAPDLRNSPSLQTPPPGPPTNNPPKPPVPGPIAADLPSQVRAGNVPGFSIGPGGQIVDKDGKPLTIPKGVVPGFDVGGWTGSRPVDQVAGVVHGEEYVVQATSQRSIERQWPGYLDYLNKTGRLPGYETGGRVDKAKQFARSMDPATYLMGGFSSSAIDCSGLVSAVVNVATGRTPFQSRMSTVTEGSWLESLGFKPGRGGAGDLRVGWWDKGGGANGHTAGTLPDGTNFESNGSEGVVIGGRTGADDKQFTQHAYLPMDSIGNPNGPGSSSAPDILGSLGLGGGGGGAGAAAGATPGSSSSSGGGSGGGSSSGGGGFSLPSSISGLSSWAFDDMVRQGEANSGPGHRDPAAYFPKAASAFVGGQVSSALGAFGVPDAPQWLGGISQLIGQIKIGGSDGGFGNAAPAAASKAIGGLGQPASAAGIMPGGASGQPGRPGPTYNIQTAKVEDAFLEARRLEDERALAKLSSRG